MTKKSLIVADINTPNDSIIVKRNAKWITEIFNEYSTEDEDKLANIEPGAQKNVQSDWNEEYAKSPAYINNKPTSITPSVHAGTHANTGTDRLVLDGSQITTGIIDASHVPAGTFQKLVVVADETARKALTSTDVAKGDTVKQNDNGLMYFVIDTTKLSSDDGWMVYTAVTPWDSITNKPQQPKSASIVLPKDSWTTAEVVQTVEVSGMTSSCSAIINAAPDSIEESVKLMVVCIEQGTGTLKFQVMKKETPTKNLNFNVLMVYA